MMRRHTRPRAYAPDPAAPGRLCDTPDCLAAGEYRAPKSRSQLNDYYWFCLDHVRDYNRSWDYCAGLTPEQIESLVRADVTWQRTTWPLGRLGGEHHVRIDRIGDPQFEDGDLIGDPELRQGVL